MTNDLFSDFEPTSKSDWIVQATRDLKGKDFYQTLSSRLWGTIEQAPFYTIEDRSLAATQHRFHAQSELPGLPPRLWANMVSVVSGDSNESILKSLENGAEGLVLHLYGVENLDELLKGVFPQYIPILIKPVGNPVQALSRFFEWADATGANPDQLSGGMLWTPSDLCYDQNESFGLALEILNELVEMTEPYPNFKAFAIQTSRYTESGGNPLDALVFGLGELMEILDKSGKQSQELFQKALLEASVGEVHFGEIARLKAFRKAVVSLAGLYQVPIKEEDVVLSVQTSHWSKSILDVNTNLIRQTYEAMAGVLGGANLLWVKPLQEESATDLDRRIARNVSTILREESYLDKVQDPAAGSFYLENITAEILDFIPAQLSLLEEKGGFENALKEGHIHAAVRASREKIQNQVQENQLAKIGANKYPASEKLQKNLDLELFQEKMHELKATRATYLVELQTLTQP
jgi:methylmalonyl-CoA mutase